MNRQRLMKISSIAGRVYVPVDAVKPGIHRGVKVAVRDVGDVLIDVLVMPVVFTVCMCVNVVSGLLFWFRSSRLGVRRTHDDS